MTLPLPNSNPFLNEPFNVWLNIPELPPVILTIGTNPLPNVLDNVESVIKKMFLLNIIYF